MLQQLDRMAEEYKVCILEGRTARIKVIEADEGCYRRRCMPLL